MIPLVVQRALQRRRKRPQRRLPPQNEPRAIQTAYYGELRAYVRVARAAVEAHVVPALPAILGDRGDAFRDDAGGKKAKAAVDAAREAFGKAVDQPQLEQLARTIGARTTDYQRGQFDKQVRAALGVDVTSPTAAPEVAAAVDDFVTSNVSLITTISDKYFDQVEQVVQRGVQQGARHEDLAIELDDRFDVADNHAGLIARDQTLKLYGQVNQIRQEDLGIDSYIWRGVLDSRERPEHVAREGETFQWADPPEDGHPGFPINCRCSAEPDFSAILGPDVEDA